MRDNLKKVSKMKQHVKVILPVLFVVLSVSSMNAISVGHSMYELGVKEGDWVEYDVVEAENYELFVEVHSGHRLRFEVVGIEVKDRMYPNFTVCIRG